MECPNCNIKMKYYRENEKLDTVEDGYMCPSCDLKKQLEGIEMTPEEWEFWESTWSANEEERERTKSAIGQIMKPFESK